MIKKFKDKLKKEDNKVLLSNFLSLSVLQIANFLLPLLAVTCEDADYGVAIKLEFAGGGTLRLEAEAVSCRMGDIDQGWPTPSRPDHNIEP